MGARKKMEHIIRFCDKCGKQIEGDFFKVLNLPFTIPKVKKGKTAFLDRGCFRQVKEIANGIP